MAAVKITPNIDGGMQQRSGRSVFRNAAGNVYWVSGSGGKIHIYKSTDGGVTWVAQDTAAEPACTSTYDLSSAINSIGQIGIVHRDAVGTPLKFTLFSTVTDSYVSTETIITGVAQYSYGSCIEFDANDKPHVAYGLSDATNDLFYINKVGAVWEAGSGSGVPLLIADSGWWPEIVINNGNIPIVFYTGMGVPVDGQITACLGNANNASSFTQQVVTTFNRFYYTSASIDSNGDIWVAVAGGNALSATLSLLHHVVTDNWATWQATTTIDATAENRYPSIAIKGTDIYIICAKTSVTAGLWYWTSVDNWAAGTLIETGDLQCPKFRWGYRNNPSYDSFPLDYVFRNNTDLEQYYNYLDIASPAYVGRPGLRSW